MIHTSCEKHKKGVSFWYVSRSEKGCKTASRHDANPIAILHENPMKPITPVGTLDPLPYVQDPHYRPAPGCFLAAFTTPRVLPFSSTGVRNRHPTPRFAPGRRPDPRPRRPWPLSALGPSSGHSSPSHEIPPY